MYIYTHKLNMGEMYLYTRIYIFSSAKITSLLRWCWFIVPAPVLADERHEGYKLGYVPQTHGCREPFCEIRVFHKLNIGFTCETEKCRISKIAFHLCLTYARVKILSRRQPYPWWIQRWTLSASSGRRRPHTPPLFLLTFPDTIGSEALLPYIKFGASFSVFS